MLTELQKRILKGEVCPYCKKQSRLVDSSEVYGAGATYGWLYLCKDCDAYVGCHHGTKTAKGRLADKTLRHWKKQAHHYFDQIWKEKICSRSDAYFRLSMFLGLEGDYCHIGMFKPETCQEVVKFSIGFLEKYNVKPIQYDNTSKKSS